jgi:hypothetical protein
MYRIFPPWTPSRKIILSIEGLRQDRNDQQTEYTSHNPLKRRCLLNLPRESTSRKSNNHRESKLQQCWRFVINVSRTPTVSNPTHHHFLTEEK